MSRRSEATRKIPGQSKHWSAEFARLKKVSQLILGVDETSQTFFFGMKLLRTHNFIMNPIIHRGTPEIFKPT